MSFVYKYTEMTILLVGIVILVFFGTVERVIRNAIYR